MKAGQKSEREGDVAVLRQVEAGTGCRRFAARWGSARRSTISGNGDILGTGVSELRELRQCARKQAVETAGSESNVDRQILRIKKAAPISVAAINTWSEDGPRRRTASFLRLPAEW
jgi:hypothetical protein